MKAARHLGKRSALTPPALPRRKSNRAEIIWRRRTARGCAAARLKLVSSYRRCEPRTHGLLRNGVQRNEHVAAALEKPQAQMLRVVASHCHLYRRASAAHAHCGMTRSRGGGAKRLASKPATARAAAHSSRALKASRSASCRRRRPRWRRHGGETAAAQISRAGPVIPLPGLCGAREAGARAVVAAYGGHLTALRKMAANNGGLSSPRTKPLRLQRRGHSRVEMNEMACLSHARHLSKKCTENKRHKSSRLSFSLALCAHVARNIRRGTLASPL